MKRIFIHNTLFRILAPPVYGILVYLLVLLVNNSLFMLNQNFFTEEMYISMGLSLLVFESNRAWMILLQRFFNEEDMTSRVLALIGGNTLITFLVVTAAISAYFTQVLGFTTFKTEATYFNIIFVITSWLYNLVYISNIYLHRQNIEKLEEESSLREHIEMEFDEFTNDINPELLYESLETLISLVHKDPVMAEDYIDRLSYAYRYILSNKQNELIDLNEDLRATENLIKLLNVRHMNLINLENKISEENMHIQVIPGTIPGIIENVVRKTIINKDQPLTISLHIDNDGYLSVIHKANDRLLPGKFDPHLTEKLQQAYYYYSDKPVVQVEAYQECYIKIPALELSKQELAI